MALPPLLVCKSEAEYLAEYDRTYCRGTVMTFDNIRVYFDRDKFRHAFYESSKRDGIKDRFSPIRAQRMGWIESTLICPDAELYMGWDKIKRRYDASNRVSVVYEDFVVVIRLCHKEIGVLKGEFVTCYQADNSIGKIIKSPKWTLEKCMAEFANKKGR
jgi:hypothetical protein